MAASLMEAGCATQSDRVNVEVDVRIEPPRRLEMLSFTHHAEVARLPLEVGDRTG
jgi:hypothetical protein